MFELKRQQAEALGYTTSPYDALLDDYEPGESTANVARVLAELRAALVPLVAAIADSGRRPDASILTRHFPEVEQERFGTEAAAAIGFDFTRGRLDVTAHPFCTHAGAARLPHHHALRRALFSNRRSSAFCTRRATAFTSRGCRRIGSACRWARRFRWAFTNRSRGCGRTWWAAAGPSGSISIPAAQAAFPRAGAT